MSIHFNKLDLCQVEQRMTVKVRNQLICVDIYWRKVCIFTYSEIILQPKYYKHLVGY